MAPRAYNNDFRQLQQADLKARIAAAAAELHATQGALATSYAQIAERAGVSLPTVYKHYPTLDELIGACTAHVATRAPQMPHERLAAAPDVPAMAALLVEACDATNAYFEPWRSWREQSRIPALAHFLAAQREQFTAMLAALLEQHGVTGAAPVAAVWESVLAFDFWHRLVREHKLSRGAARERQTDLLLAAAGPQPATEPARMRPSRKTHP